ncbi:unnamed protein product [Taenia asiatica]|uniref:DUF5727 domain-containing protein n=1 Tax=Taenia asiatica TaxID=60517 RepID=A0A0R3W8Z3_TAEAS|nr:unnamed protein product [Taenia asiatica]
MVQRDIEVDLCGEGSAVNTGHVLLFATSFMLNKWTLGSITAYGNFEPEEEFRSERLFIGKLSESGMQNKAPKQQVRHPTLLCRYRKSCDPVVCRPRHYNP